MKPGYIEAAPIGEVKAQKDYWNGQLLKAGLGRQYRIVAHEVPGISQGRIFMGIFVEPRKTGKTPRCPLCCGHGRLLTANCGWCSNDYDPDHLADVSIAEDEPMWLCSHGIGVERGV